MTSEDKRIIDINLLLNQLKDETVKRDQMQVDLCKSMHECIRLRNKLKALGYTGPHYAVAS